MGQEQKVKKELIKAAVINLSMEKKKEKQRKERKK